MLGADDRAGAGGVCGAPALCRRSHCFALSYLPVLYQRDAIWYDERHSFC
ncbi:hypothetical protein ETAR_19320 [Edwardsiella tarda]